MKAVFVPIWGGGGGGGGGVSLHDGSVIGTCKEVISEHLVVMRLSVYPSCLPAM